MQKNIGFVRVLCALDAGVGVVGFCGIVYLHRNTMIERAVDSVLKSTGCAVAMIDGRRRHHA